MQLCALFSQLHQHVDALEQAKKSVKLTHLLIKDMYSLCDFYVEKHKIGKSQMGEAASTIQDSNNDVSTSNVNITANLEDAVDEITGSTDSQAFLSAATHNNLEEPLSLIEKTAMRVKPILEEVLK